MTTDTDPQIAKLLAEMEAGLIPEANDAADRADDHAANGKVVQLQLAPTDDPAPIALAPILEDVQAFVARFVVLTPHQRTAVTLWLVHTYVFREVAVTPYLDIYAPEKQSGKTRLMEVMAPLCSNPLFIAGASPAAIMRAVDSGSFTLLYDEMDATTKGDQDAAQKLRGILNSGFQMNGRFLACEPSGKGKWEAKMFNTFSPKATAGIGRIPETVRDRAIPIAMQRKQRGVGTEPWSLDDPPPEAATLAQRLQEWADTHSGDISPLRPEPLPELDDRANDLWRILRTLAALAGEKWPQAAKDAALALSTGNADGQSEGVELLAAIRAIFDGKHADEISTEELLKRLSEADESAWREWYWNGQATPNAARELSQALKPYGIGPGPIRLGTAQMRGYKRENFVPAWNAYLPA
jgi:hypothetical protein